MATLKPPVRAARPAALVYRERCGLSPFAVEALFRGAEILSEGRLEADRGAVRWYGSVMISFDLDALARSCRDLGEGGALERVATLAERSIALRVRIHRLARAELERRFPDRELGRAEVESHFSREGGRLLVDVDVEAPLAEAAGHASGAAGGGATR